jgi:hypothetical protein
LDVGAVERNGAEPCDGDEVIAVCGDLEAAQRSQARREIVQVVIVDVVAFAQTGPGRVEQPDNRIGIFKVRDINHGCRRDRHDIPGDQTANSDEVDVTTTDIEEKHTCFCGQISTRGDLNQGRRHTVVGGLLVDQQRRRG